MCAQNSTAKPTLVIKLTTETALISISYPPNIMFKSQLNPIKLKAMQNTFKATNIAVFGFLISIVVK